MRILLLITLIAITGTTASAQKQKHKNKAVTEYTIDDKKVSKKEFNNFLSGLKEQEHTWFCDETSTGGMTGYDGKDKDGVLYEYRAETDSGSQKNTIKKSSLK